MESLLAELAIVLALIAANGVFSGAEIAVLSVRRMRLVELIDQGSRGARRVQRLQEEPERFLATVQIGITVVSATAAAFGGAAMAARLAAPLAAAGMSDQTAARVAFAGVVGLVSYLSLVVGELIPKSLALRYSERYAVFIGRPLWWLSSLMRPLVWLLTASSNLVLRLFGDRTTFTEARLSPEELQQLVEEAGRSGSLDPRAAEIASRALEMRELTAAAVMVPRNRVVALAKDAGREEVKRVLLEEGHGRLPVYEGSIDHIVGYVVARDLLAMAWEADLIVLEDVIRPAYFVPETARAVDVLNELQRRRTHLAVVVDELGGVAGLLTVEDLLEELVGDIRDEDERGEELIRVEDGVATAHGVAPIREVNRALSIELPENEGVTTLGGLCTTLAGSIPAPGTQLTAPDGTRLEVLDASPRRVRLVKVTPAPSREASTPA